ncbi:MAG: hypothetical protein AAF585_03155 [Verrucomicrobiota bacterium]
MKVELKGQGELKLPSHCLSLTRGAGDQLFTACLDGGIYAVDAEAKTYHEIARHDNFASGVNWSAAAGRLITAGYDGNLKWIDPAAKTVEREVDAHDFWSWQSAISPDGKRIASVTGQYLSGGYKYEPAPEREPSVRVYNVETGEETHHFEHVPPVESVAFSRDGAFVAAGNMMGEVRIWNLDNGKEVARIETPSFTGWGIIKGHYYTGGVFSLAFAPDDQSIFLAGMGTTRDPAAGNGKQLWERWSWREGNVEKLTSAIEGEIGNGLMETLTFHPSGKYFVMAGRLHSGGDWNVAIFDTETGSRIAKHDTKLRMSKAVWSEDGSRLFLAGGGGQPKKKEDLEKAEWGRVRVSKIGVSEE